MTYAQYWILDAVVEGRYSLSTLREDVIETAFNRRGHGLTRPQLVETLATLFSQGDIVVQEDESPREFSLGAEGIEDALTSSRWIWYGLTRQGSSKWEEASQPKWDRFIMGGLDVAANDCEVASGNRAAIVEYLHDAGVRERIVPGTVVWREMTDWQATYWKRLPVGFEVHFQIRNPEQDFLVAQPPGDWYTNPYATS